MIWQRCIEKGRLKDRNRVSLMIFLSEKLYNIVMLYFRYLFNSLLLQPQDLNMSVSVDGYMF